MSGVSTVQSNEAVNLWHDPAVVETYVNAENASRPFAKLLVKKSGIAELNQDAHVFDLATGTGACIQELYDAVPKEKWGGLKVLGGDVSAPMLEYLKERGKNAGWTGMETKVMDGRHLDLSKDTYTHIFVSFAIFVMPDALTKLYESLKPGGYIGITTWEHLPWSSMYTKAVSNMTATFPMPPIAGLENKMFAGRDWGSEAYVQQYLEEAGFCDVQVSKHTQRANMGKPKAFMEVLQIPFTLVKMGFPEDKREELMRELNEVMSKEAIEMAGGEDGQVPMECEGLIGVGWKRV